MITAWFMLHPLPAKKMYITMVRTNDPMYIPRVLPIRIQRQTRESVSMMFARQVSAQECARSTSRINPRSKKSIAPTMAKEFPQKMKNFSGIKKVSTIRANQAIIFGPQYPF